MTNVLGGTLNVGAAVGFGGLIQGIVINSLLLPPTLVDNVLLDVIAFSMSPHAGGVITDISGWFRNTVSLSLLVTTVTVFMEVYVAPAGSTVFTRQASLPVATLSGLIGIGGYYVAASGLNIPLDQNDRVAVVYRVGVTGGIDIVTTVTGFVGGSLTINLT